MNKFPGHSIVSHFSVSIYKQDLRILPICEYIAVYSMLHVIFKYEFNLLFCMPFKLKITNKIGIY